MVGGLYSGLLGTYTDGLVMSTMWGGLATKPPNLHIPKPSPGLYSQTSHLSSIFDNDLITKPYIKPYTNVWKMSN